MIDKGLGEFVHTSVFLIEGAAVNIYNISGAQGGLNCEELEQA